MKDTTERLLDIIDKLAKRESRELRIIYGMLKRGNVETAMWFIEHLNDPKSDYNDLGTRESSAR